MSQGKLSWSKVDQDPLSVLLSSEPSELDPEPEGSSASECRASTALFNNDDTGDQPLSVQPSTPGVAIIEASTGPAPKDRALVRGQSSGDSRRASRESLGGRDSPLSVRANGMRPKPAVVELPLKDDPPAPPPPPSPSPPITSTISPGDPRQAHAPSSPAETAESVPLLCGEQRLAHLPNLCLQTVHGMLIPGQFLITGYQVIFLPYLRPMPPPLSHLPSEYFRIPMSCIERMEREQRKQSTRDAITSLLLLLKDGRALRIVVPEATAEVSAERIFSLIHAYAFPGDITRHLFCFTHYKALAAAGSPLVAGGAGVYDIEAEFERQFSCGSSGSWLSSPACPWRYTSINKDYAVCSNYPKLLIVPKDIRDDELVASAAFRAEGRLPVLTWGRPGSAASIWRSSQPKVGMASNSCYADEKLLTLLAACVSNVNFHESEMHQEQDVMGSDDASLAMAKATGILRIFDLRPKTSALANRATGYGSESTTNYPACSVTFMNIGNIHAIRDAFTRFTALMHSMAAQEVEWGGLVEGTKWLSAVRLLIHAAYKTAAVVLRDNAPVLLHCSHGWDRTSQVAALAQLMLDPYHRTFQGFMVLVEKEFMSLGHPFQLRCGHGQDKGTRIDEQLSPIFLQFLDCVWQLLNQHPNLFEFNAQYLLCIAHHIYDCRFGTFLCNTEKDREALRERTPSPSLWVYLHHIRDSLLNPLYGKGHGAIRNRILESPLPSLLRRVTIWTDYWFRFSARPCHPADVYSRMQREDVMSYDVPPPCDFVLPWVADERDDLPLVYAQTAKQLGELKERGSEQLQSLLKELAELDARPADDEDSCSDAISVDSGVELERCLEEKARLRKFVQRQTQVLADLCGMKGSDGTASVPTAERHMCETGKDNHNG